MVDRRISGSRKSLPLSPESGTRNSCASGSSANCAPVTREIVVRPTPTPPPHAPEQSVWPIRGESNRKTENLYSAWIETLFDAPLHDELSWPALHVVLRDKSRNFLFNYLGLGEDEKNLVYRPDCADLPYFLRAYFAFKMGLPFGYSKCSRGGGGKGAEMPAMVQHRGSGNARRSGAEDRRNPVPAFSYNP